MAAQHAGVAEDAIGQVAHRTGQQQPERHRPDRIAQPRRHLDHHDHDDHRDQAQPDGQSGRQAEGGSGVRGVGEAQEAGDGVDRSTAAQRVDRDRLRDDVCDVGEDADDHEQADMSPVRLRFLGALDRLGGVAVIGRQRRSSRCLHVMHSVARGNTINRRFPIGLPHDSQTPYVRSSSRSRARSVWISMSRVLLASDISESRSSEVDPTSAWSLPAPSPPARSRSWIPCSTEETSARNRSRSASSWPRTSAISAAVQGFSSGSTTRSRGPRPGAFLAGAFFSGAFFSGAFLAVFLAAGFFAGAFLAVFFAATSLTGPFLVGDFLAGAFFVTDFLAAASLVACLPSACFAAVFFAAFLAVFFAVLADLVGADRFAAAGLAAAFFELLFSCANGLPFAFR